MTTSIPARIAPPASLPFALDDVLIDDASRHVATLTRFNSRNPPAGDQSGAEDIRLARDIHDGVLQALTGAALQLEAASKLIQTDPAAARARCHAVSELIAAEQRELRALIRRSASASTSSLSSLSEVAALLERFRDRIGQEWQLRIELTVGGHGRLPRTLGDDIYCIVRECLANVARHAGARTARVALFVVRDSVRIKVIDDGHGFPFRGRVDLPALVQRGIGPKSLRERVTVLGGELIIVSSRSGSSVEISLPLTHVAG